MNIEPLESRIAPATLTGQVLTYTDLDGDKVAITFSNGALAGGMFTFNTGSVNGDNSTPQQLQDIDVGTAVGISGADITMKVTKAGAGDGLAAVGRVTAVGVDLGKITLKGDLGGLELGTGTAGTPAVELLSVQSMGVYGSATQASPNRETAIFGSLGALKVTGDVQNVFIRLPLTGDAGRIGSITIGATLLGGAADNSGLILAGGDIGPVKIGRNLLGGSGDESGKIESRAGNIASVIIGGSLISGTGTHDTFTDLGGAVHSGQLYAFGTLGPVKVGRDISTEGFTGGVAVHARLDMGSVTIGGTLQGRDILGDSKIGLVKIALGGVGNITASGDIAGVTIGGNFTGNIRALSVNDLGPVKIAGNFGGILLGEGALGNVTIGGTITSQSIIEGGLGGIGAVKIGGDVFRLELTSGAGVASVAIGGSWENNGIPSEILTVPGDLGSFKIGRDLQNVSGTVGGRLGALEIRGTYNGADLKVDEVGSAKFGRIIGFFSASGDVGAVSVAGSLRGQFTAFGNKVASFTAGSVDGSFSAGSVGNVAIKGALVGSLQVGVGGVVKIGGDAHGGISGTEAASISIGGSMRGDFSTFAGVIFTGTVKKLSIGGDFQGANIPEGDTLLTRDFISAGRFGSIFIGGSLLAGTDDRTTGTGVFRSGFIESGHEIGSITIKGDVRGSVGAGGKATQALIFAGTGMAKGAANLAIGSLTIGGTVERAGIHAGIGSDPFSLTDGNAQIGAVKVGGDWIASSLTAGVRDLDGDGFGDADDAIVDTPPGAAADAIIARIASISIKGVVAGSTTGDRFGFVAQQIGSFKATGFTAPLTTSTDAPIELAFATGNVTIREV